MASEEDPAGGSSDVGSDVCVVPDLLPTAVSVRTVVAEKWMEWFVLDLVECPFVSRTSAVVRTFGPAVSEEYSPVVLAGECLTCRWLSQIQRECLSYRSPVVSSRPYFWVKVALDVVGLGVGPPCLQVDSEDTLLALIDEQAQSVRAAPGYNPGGWICRGGASPETDRAFGSGKGW